MGGPDSFGTPPSYHKTLSGDLGLIHRAHRGFAYRDFATCEDKGSYPLVSQVPKHRNPFTLHRFGISHTGISHIRISQHAKTRVHTLWFPGYRNAETHSHFTDSGYRIPGFRISGFRNMRRQGFIPFGFPGTETLKPIHTSPIRDSHTGISHIGISNGNPFTFTASGYCRDFTYGILQHAKTWGSYHWVSRELKLRNPIYTKLFSGFRMSGFHNVRRRGVSYLGFPGSRNSEAHLLRDRGKVNSRIYYNGSLFKGLTPTLECEGTFPKKVPSGG
jgi:hypothetical protein